MPFIGNQPALSYTSFAKQDFTTSATTSYTLDNPVANANELALFINFVRQEPTTAYSASGTSLTLTSATSATDDMYCVFLGKAVQTVNPPNASVGTAQIADSAVTYAKSTGFGKIAQVIQTTKTDAWSQSTTDQTFYNPTGFSVAITPSSTSSKIIIMACCSWSATTNYEIGTKITRTVGGSEVDILIGDAAGSRTRTFLSERSNAAADYATTTMILLDSPNTTSEITYKPVAATESSATLYLNKHHSDNDQASEFRAASNIIVSEVLE